MAGEVTPEAPRRAMSEWNRLGLVRLCDANNTIQVVGITLASLTALS